MSRIQVYVHSIWFECPDCKAKNITEDIRPYKCDNCGADLTHAKYTKID